MRVQLFLDRLGQDNPDRHLSALPGGHRECLGLQAAQQEIGVVGADAPVAVDVGLGIDVIYGSHGIVQDDLRVVCVGIAILIQVAVHLGHRLVFLAVHGKGHMSRQGGGLGI